MLYSHGGMCAGLWEVRRFWFVNVSIGECWVGRKCSADALSGEHVLVVRYRHNHQNVIQIG